MRLVWARLRHESSFQFDTMTLCWPLRGPRCYLFGYREHYWSRIAPTTVVLTVFLTCILHSVRRCFYGICEGEVSDKINTWCPLECRKKTVTLFSHVKFCIFINVAQIKLCLLIANIQVVHFSKLAVEISETVKHSYLNKKSYTVLCSFWFIARKKLWITKLFIIIYCNFFICDCFGQLI